MKERVRIATVYKMVKIGLFEELTVEPDSLKDEKAPVVDDLVVGHPNPSIVTCGERIAARLGKFSWVFIENLFQVLC